jgi:hypothetical protein
MHNREEGVLQRQCKTGRERERALEEGRCENILGEG